MTYTIARNDRTTLYEVHAAGCRHLGMSPRLEVMTTTETDLTADEFAAEFDRRNDGCTAKVSPCARKVN